MRNKKVGYLVVSIFLISALTLFSCEKADLSSDVASAKSHTAKTNATENAKNNIVAGRPSQGGKPDDGIGN